MSTISDRVREGTQRITGLSGHQQELLRRLADGKSVMDIACELNITGGTIKAHLQRVYRVLGVKSRAEAVAAISPAGPVPPGTVKSLCAREREVLTLLADNLSMIDIAKSLKISINTVRKHLSLTYQSLRVKDRSEAVALFRGEVRPVPGVTRVPGAPARTASARLSQRERQVLDLLALDRSRDDIACRLGITKGTLRGHISRIYDILGVQNLQDAVATVQDGKKAAPTSRLAGLTERELDVLGLVSNGLSAKETAAVLGISQGTVYVYLSNIYRTVAVKNRSEAVALFREGSATAIGPGKVHITPPP